MFARRLFLFLLTGLLFLPTDLSSADEKLKGIACRSVHFGYPGPDADVFYNEITVQSSAPGTYFCVIGWNKGYFGIQQLANDKRVAIFSVWDSGDNDPNALANELRTQVLHVDPDVTVRRFGGEGSGGQSFFPFPWEEGKTYRMAVVCRQLEHRTAYSGWLVDPDSGQWRHLITFSTITGGKPMNGFYSFVEDFKRDRKSTQFTRSATFGNMFRYTDQDRKLLPQTKARFTGDSNPVTNIDARILEKGIQLNTGGDLSNDHIALNQSFEVENTAPKDSQWVAELVRRSRADTRTPEERKSASHQRMNQQNTPFLSALPTLPLIQNTHRRTSEEVWQRLLVETALTAKADGLPAPQWLDVRQAIAPQQLSRAEADFLDSQRPDVNDQIDFLWRAERARVLAWSLKMEAEMPWPSKTTLPEELLSRVENQLGKSPASHELRSQGQMLDQADLCYRLHWSVLNAQYMDRDPPAQLQADVLAERHHALAWLLGLPSLESADSAQAIAWAKVKPTVQQIREFASPKSGE